MLPPRRTIALPLALCWLVLVVHASLYPFVGWRSQDMVPWAYLTAPWSPYWTGFDVGINIAGYVPLGFLSVLAAARSGYPRLAWCVGLLGPVLLSAVLEGLQSYLPQRVPSKLDLLLNALGGVVGAVLALLLLRWRLIIPWNRFRDDWLSHDTPISYVVLLLWPLAVLYPTPVPYGLGQIGEHVWFALSQWLQDTPFLVWLPTKLEHQPLDLWHGLCVVTASLLAPLLLGSVLWPAVRQRSWWIALCGGLLVPLSGGWSAALTHGWHRAWEGFTVPVCISMVMAMVLSLSTLHVSRRHAAWLLTLVLLPALWLLNQAPIEPPYFVMALSAWSQGPFTRIHGLSMWLGWLWPYAALAVAVHCLVCCRAPDYNAEA